MVKVAFSGGRSVHKRKVLEMQRCLSSMVRMQGGDYHRRMRGGGSVFWGRKKEMQIQQYNFGHTMLADVRLGET